MDSVTDIESFRVPTNARHNDTKKVPTLYEPDRSKYAGPHRWQIRWWARLVRRLWRRRAYTQWLDEACERLDVVGLEHLADIGGPCIFIANHQSHLDTLVVHAALPESIKSNLYFGAAQDRWFVKGQRKMVRQPWYQSLALGNFPVMRGGGHQALAYARWLLTQGQHVFLFPEGTRATDDELGEFKHGPAILALAHGVPVVPICLSGLRALRPKGSRKAQRGTVGIEFLAPVRFASDTQVNDATAILRMRLSAVHGQPA